VSLLQRDGDHSGDDREEDDHKVVALLALWQDVAGTARACSLIPHTQQDVRQGEQAMCPRR
jgi:hypothetical protein